MLIASVVSSQAQLTWSLRPLPKGGSLGQVVFGAQKFVTRPGDYAVATSTTGQAWSLVNTPMEDNDILATSGGSHFVAGDLGWGSSLYSSTNGTSWTRITGLPDVEYLNELNFSGGRYVGICELSEYDLGVIYSNSALTLWAAKVFSPDGYLESVGYGAGLFVASSEVDGVRSIYSSPDAVTWTKRVTVGSAEIIEIRFLNNQFVAVGGGGTLYTSSNGTSWVKRSIPVKFALNDVAYGKSTYVAIGDYGTILSSKDNGVTWVRNSSGVWADLYWVAFGANTFVASGADGTVLQSN